MTKGTVLPYGWKKKTVGHLFDVQLGKMLNEKAKTGPQFPYLANFNVRWGYFDFSKLNKMNFSDREKEKFKLQKGDLLMCEGGEIGRCAVWNGFEVEIYYQKALHRVRPIKSDAFTKYLYFYMQLVTSQGKLDRIVGESSIAHLTREKLLELPITFPLLPEQRAIADLLSTWDEAIEKTERLIQAKEKRFRWLLRSLISDQCLKKNTFKNMKLGECGFIYSGLVGKDKSHFGSGKAYLPYLNLYQNYSVNPKQLDYVKINDEENQKKVSKGDVFFTVSSETPDEVGMSSVLLNELGECYLNSFCFGWRPSSNELLSEYLQFYFRSSIFRKQMLRLAQGVTRFNLSKSALAESDILYPSIEEQQQIAQTLIAAQQEIDLLKRLAEKYKTQKRGLMQKMLTGEWRVKPEIVNQYKEA